MEEERFQQLLTQLVVKKARELKPNLYNGSEEDIIAGLNKNEQDKNQIMNWIKKLGDSGELEQELSALEQEQEQSSYLKEGGKLDYLQSLKKGGKMKSKKCSCGCDLVMKKEKGGKMVQSCACGCKPKLEKGGMIQKLQQGTSSVMYLDDQGLPKVARRTSTYTRLNLTPRNDDYYLSGPYYAGSGLKTSTQATTPKQSVVAPQQNKTVVQKTQAPITTPQPAAQPVATKTTTQPVATQKTQVPVATQKPIAQPNPNISVVDYLNSMGRASDRTARAALAKELGMGSYNFSAADNLKLLQLIKQKGRNTGEMMPETPRLAVPVNVPGMSIPVPKVQATPAVPGLVPRQGFNK